MLLPNSEASLERSRISTTNPISVKTGSASLTIRHVLDISPGQVCSGRAVDDKNARLLVRIVVPPLRLPNGGAGIDPIDGNLVVRIGEVRARLLRLEPCVNGCMRPRRRQ